MQIPLQISFHNVDHSPQLEARVREAVAKLEHFYDRIIGCRVAIELPHRHHHQGALYRVRIHLTLPDGDIEVTRSPDEDHAHEDPYVAIRDAFKAARRRLEDYARRRRGVLKTHETPQHGRITALDRASGFGEIVTADGREVRFHRNSVVEADFDQLSEGIEVRFSEVAGEDGPFASTVHVLRRHHIVP